MERSDTAIDMWFWPRNSAVPGDVKGGSSSVNPQNWVSGYNSTLSLRSLTRVNTIGLPFGQFSEYRL